MFLARSSRQIGDAVRRARKLQNLSQSALAQKAGVRQAAISGLETGEQGVRLDTLLELLAALGLELQIAPRSSGATQSMDELF